jgi:CheY-like chemotaxis protein
MSLDENLKTVLLADDEPTVRLVLEKILRSAGFVVISAENGLKAQQLADRHDGEIDVLISDILMPGVSGFELARQLLAERPKTRVLLISGYMPEGVEFPAGWQFLRKPFTPGDLTQTVHSLLRVAA